MDNGAAMEEGRGGESEGGNGGNVKKDGSLSNEKRKKERKGRINTVQV